MNEFGQIAMSHWQKHRPLEFQQIPDPQAHFSAMGDQAQQQATQIEEDAIRSLPPTSDYLQDVGRRNQARLSAREIVLAEMLLPPEDLPETTSEPDAVGPEGMPSDPSHPLWADLDDDSISPSEFQRRRREWIDSLPTR